MQSRTSFIQQLQKDFPKLEGQPLETLISENLISPFTIRLPVSVLKQAQQSIATLFELRENKKYQDSYKTELDALELKDPGNKSICMSYDFHVNDENQLKLIEVNTNAAFLALGYEMYKSRNFPLPVKDFSLEEFRKDIETEIKLNGKTVPNPLSVAIIDEEPEKQRLYIEFLVYQELFKQWGWDAKIMDYRKLESATPDFIYNRFTDFFLSHPESQQLKKYFLTKQICFSPNPYEYFLLADKQRLIDWSQPEKLAHWSVSAEQQALIQSIVPYSISLELHNKEEIWAKRKSIFIKPKRAFGSKQSYKGASISRKNFDELAGNEFIAQEFVAPSEQMFRTPKGEESFKFDLRCFAYQGRLQLVVARLYQGQVTNLRTPLGGFACTEFY
ncbi:MAG: hypothetical protein ACXWRE_01040 [Pseudobdellovibrionaceae bacterium]